jgi:hypothetical protein
LSCDPILGASEAVPCALQDYLAPFRDGRIGTRLPERRRARRRGKARAHDMARELLPPTHFDLAMGTYHKVRQAIGHTPGRGRVLPDFLVAGVAKCATTSLYDWICEHPHVVRPTTEGRARKELLFFDYNYSRGIDWYRRHFPLAEARRSFERQHSRPFLTGEASASYLTGHWVPGRVHAAIPGVKLIVTMRNPVDRAYSAFQMSRREGLEECESFESALALEDERLAGEVERVRRSPRYNPRTPPPLGYWSYLLRSRYADHVARWLDLFPREQLLFLEFEQLAADPQGTLDRVHTFLGLSPYRNQDLPQLNGASYAAMDPRTREALVHYFRPYNQRLRELTGVEFEWDA